MVDALFAALILMGLADAMLLAARLMERRARERRIQARLRESAHLYGLLRVMLADRRFSEQRPA